MVAVSCPSTGRTFFGFLVKLWCLYLRPGMSSAEINLDVALVGTKNACLCRMTYFKIDTWLCICLIRASLKSGKNIQFNFWPSQETTKTTASTTARVSHWVKWIFQRFSSKRLTSKLFTTKFWSNSEEVCRKKVFGLAAVCPDLANFRHFGETLKVFGNILRGYLVFGILMNILWQIWSAIRQIVIVAYGKIFKNNLAIWSHCLQCYLMYTTFRAIIVGKTLLRMDANLCLLVHSVRNWVFWGAIQDAS